MVSAFSIVGDGAAAVAALAGRQRLALLDQGARQGIGEDPLRQAEGDGLAHAGLAGAVARFQMRVHHQAGIGMAGEIGIAGLRHRLGGRQRQIHHERRAGLAMRADHHFAPT